MPRIEIRDAVNVILGERELGSKRRIVVHEVFRITRVAKPKQMTDLMGDYDGEGIGRQIRDVRVCAGIRIEGNGAVIERKPIGFLAC